MTASGDPHVLVGPEGRQHHLPGHAQATPRPSTETTASSSGQPSRAGSPSSCPSAAPGASGARPAPYPSRGPARPGAIPVATSDLDRMAKAALRAFRDAVPASCRDALAETIMEG